MMLPIVAGPSPVFRILSEPLRMRWFVVLVDAVAFTVHVTVWVAGSIAPVLVRDHVVSALWNAWPSQPSRSTLALGALRAIALSIPPSSGAAQAAIASRTREPLSIAANYSGHRCAETYESAD